MPIYESKLVNLILWRVLMKLKIILNITLGALLLSLFTGCLSTQFKIENKKFNNSYPYHIQDLTSGRHTLRMGYNIVSYLPYTKENLNTLKAVLSDLNNYSKSLKVMKCGKRDTFLQCTNNFAQKPTQNLIYFLKSDLQKTEQIGHQCRLSSDTSAVSNRTVMSEIIRTL